MPRNSADDPISGLMALGVIMCLDIARLELDEPGDQLRSASHYLMPKGLLMTEQGERD